MGVQGLWQLIDSVGRPVTLESLENKILAIDVSIWLNQAVRGYREGQGSHSVQNAHLLTLFNRICKLLHYRIKPVFVFDGGVPILKKQTLAARRQRKELAAKQSHNVSQKLLMNYIRKQVVEQKLSNKDSDKSKRMNKGILHSTKSPSKKPDLYELPPMPHTFKKSDEDERSDSDDDRINLVEEQLHNNFQDLDSLNLDCVSFQSLPVEIRHEILTECKDLRKKNSWAVMESMPKESGNFSNFQMSRLLKRRSLQQHLEKVEKEMAAQSSGQVSSLWSQEFRATDHMSAVKRIMSEESTHFILLEGLNKGNLSNSISPISSSSSSNSNKNIGASADLKSINTKETEVTKKDENLETIDTVISSDDDKDYSDSNILEHYQKLFHEATSTTSVSRINKDKDSPISKRPFEIDVATDNAKWESDSYSAAYDVTQYIDNSKTQEIFENSNKTTYIPKGKVKEDNLLKDSFTQQSIKKMSSESEDKVLLKNKSSSSNLHLNTNEEPLEKLITFSSVVDSPNMDSNCLSSVSSISNSCLMNSDSNEDKKKVNTSILGKKELLEKNSSNEEINYSDSPSSKRMKLNSESSESSDDFIEVTINPQNIKEDDLFPIEVFNTNIENTSNNLSDKPSIKKEIKTTFHPPVTEIVSPSISEVQDNVGISETKDVCREDVFPDILSPEDAFLNKQISSDLSVDQLKNLSNDLQEKEQELAKEKSKHDRTAAVISDVMYTDSQELLRLFGIPFVISPMEAEAQCAFLDTANLTEGTITEDSDVWLFGGKRVYKNFFNQKKHVEFFRNTDIKKNFGLDQEKLICLALLTGSDYTDGIEGIGCVTAMELFSEFPGDGLISLKSFKEWWDKAQKELKISQETKIKEKLRHVSVQPGFPNEAVYGAYFHPTVDESAEKFSWSLPDLDALRNFTEINFGWSKTKTDEILIPLLKHMNVRETQSRLDSFFHVTLNKNPLSIPSKRVQRAINKISKPKLMEIEETPKQKAIRIINESKKVITSKKKNFCKDLKIIPDCEKTNKNRSATQKDKKKSYGKKTKMTADIKPSALPSVVALSEESSTSE